MSNTDVPMTIEFYLEGAKHPFASHQFEQPVPVPNEGETVVVVDDPGAEDWSQTRHEVLERKFMYYGIKKRQVLVMLSLSDPID